MELVAEIIEMELEESQNEINQPSEVEPPKRWLPNSGVLAKPRETEPNKIYLATAMELVEKSLALSNQAPLEPEELFNRAQTWAEVLFEIIPEPELKPTFNRAFKDNETTFPVSAPMLKNAFEKILQEREYAKIKHYQANDKGKDPECEFCFDSGFCSIDRDGYNVPLQSQNQLRGVRKCHCDYWEKRIAKVKHS